MKQEGIVLGGPRPTECSCAECVKCCKDQPGALGPGDYERIREKLAQPDVSHLFRSSDGALVHDSDTKRTFRVRTIVPLYDRRAKRCVFLGADDRCTIHEVKPMGCGLFDTHMDNATAMARTLWVVKEQQDEKYQELRRTLKVTDHYKPRRF
jgi:Fe-S-cluster containining protein